MKAIKHTTNAFQDIADLVNAVHDFLLACARIRQSRPQSENDLRAEGNIMSAHLEKLATAYEQVAQSIISSRETINRHEAN